MDEIIRDSVIAFVVLFVAIGAAIIWYATACHRSDKTKRLSELPGGTPLLRRLLAAEPGEVRKAPQQVGV
jgi:hypothetical protein